jgi:hypothetical protein
VNLVLELHNKMRLRSDLITSCESVEPLLYLEAGVYDRISVIQLTHINIYFNRNIFSTAVAVRNTSQFGPITQFLGIQTLSSARRRRSGH